MQKKQVGLVWFRNDLRVNDNESLTNAVEENDSVIAIYCFDKRQFEPSKYGNFKKSEKFRTKFTLESVSELKLNLEKLNISLLVYYQNTEEIIPKIVANFNVNSIYFQEEWTNEELEIEQKLKSNLTNLIEFKKVYTQFLFHPEDIPFTIATIPNVYTQFRNKCEKVVKVRKIFLPKIMNFDNLIENHTEIPTLEVLGFEDFKADKRTAFPFAGGENQALKRLQNYFFENQNLSSYKQTRNGLIGTNYSSKFSAWLANGCISPKSIYWQVCKYENEIEKNESTYWLLFELIWRDYFKYISMKYGSSIFKIEGILQKKYDWKNNKTTIENWINGKTNEPFINANMIELKKTGFMSNRGRQNVASYFAKNLLLDWRIGAAYFESMLIDYDVHSNYGNWMYISGVGNDPRDRTFNIKLQSQNYDPQNDYQNMWLEV